MNMKMKSSKANASKKKIKLKTLNKHMSNDDTAVKSPKKTKSNEKIKKSSKKTTQDQPKQKQTKPTNDDQTELFIKDESDDEQPTVNFDKEIISHKKSLKKLKKTDPEFYNFLKQNDKKLLEFKLSDDENEEDDDDEKDSSVHVPDEELQVASDESDFEADDDEAPKNDRKVTLKLLKKWQADLETDKSKETISCVIKAFHSAMVYVSGSSDEEVLEYKVGGAAVFNGIIQLCVLYLHPAIKRFLKIQSGSKMPIHKYKKFNKIKALLRGYFSNLNKLLSGVSSVNILNILLKHLHHVSPMLASFSKTARLILNRLIKIWSTQEDSVRVVAFLCILRITNNQKQEYLEYVLKRMYMAFVQNGKFVSPNTLAGINFMRRSLVEMYALDLNVSYEHVFLYIRQLAIHLRNAITLKRKEHIQAVCNWQFINSIHLWADLLAATCNKKQLQSLLYPLVQVALGTIKLVPTAQYFALRFHVIDILVHLSRDTGVYIPVLPFIYEILTTFDFNKKHKKVTMKPMLFTCILRFSKSQMLENGFKDGVLEHVYAHLLEYLSTQSHLVAFPDLVLPLIFELKKFTKKCNVTNYCKKIKQLTEKIEENARFVETERKKLTFKLSDKEMIHSWETQLQNKGTPLMQFYESWEKINSSIKNRRATQNHEIAEYTLPTLKKLKKTSKSDSNLNEDGDLELFPSDEEDNDDRFAVDEEEKVETKKRKKNTNSKRGGKKKKVEEDSDGDQEDVVEDITDW